MIDALDKKTKAIFKQAAKESIGTTCYVAHARRFGRIERMKMNLWIDCEWNSFGGELISIALVDEDGNYFYRSLDCENPHPWVAEHVIPVIGIEPINKAQLQSELQDFLCCYPAVHIIADWPQDIERFCDLLITGPGTRLDTPPLTMAILRIDSVSKVPHNALEDAKAFKETHLNAVLYPQVND